MEKEWFDDDLENDILLNGYVTCIINVKGVMFITIV